MGKRQQGVTGVVTVQLLGASVTMEGGGLSPATQRHQPPRCLVESGHTPVLTESCGNVAWVLSTHLLAWIGRRAVQNLLSRGGLTALCCAQQEA